MKANLQYVFFSFRMPDNKIDLFVSFCWHIGQNQGNFFFFFFTLSFLFTSFREQDEARRYQIVLNKNNKVHILNNIQKGR